jgi:hypothetical protein
MQIVPTLQNINAGMSKNVYSVQCTQKQVILGVGITWSKIAIGQ